MTTSPDQHKLRVPTVLAVPVSVCFLIYIWHRNYDLLGRFYDYSILTSAVGLMHSGLLPYRDFTTPLQSLTIYLCNGAELVFGRRYLALAYANLILGLLGYFLLLRTLKPSLSFFPRVLLATAFCVATFFQHGILWYNSLAMLLLAVTTLHAAKLVYAPEIRRQDTLKLCVLLFLSSMNKLNFHALGIGLVFLALAARGLVQKTGIKSILVCGGLFAAAGILLGPAVEILVNRTTLNDFVEDVIRTPGDRSAALVTLLNPKLAGSGPDVLNFLNPNLYLGTIHDYYPDNWSRGVYLIGFWIYLCCCCAAVWPLAESGTGGAPAGAGLKVYFAGLLTFLFFASLLLTVTNMETEMLTSFFLVIGLASALVMCAKYLSPKRRLVWQYVISALGAYFLVAGSASAFMHSRVRYREPSWLEAALQAVHQQRTLAAMKDAVPFFDAEAISPDLEPYFAGVRFTQAARERLISVVAFMKRVEGGKPAPNIYWGPGLEILERVYGGRRTGRLPLWYHLGVTVRDRDASRIIGELARARYEWIVAADMKTTMPSEVIEYIQKSYHCVEDDKIVVYQRVH